MSGQTFIMWGAMTVTCNRTNDRSPGGHDHPRPPIAPRSALAALIGIPNQQFSNIDII